MFVLGYQFWWIKDVSPRQWYKSFRTYRTFFSVIKPHSSCSLPSLYIVNANCCCLLSLQQGDRHFKEEDDSSTCSNNNNNDINGISTRKCCASCDYTIGPTAISCVRLLVEILGQSSRWKYRYCWRCPNFLTSKYDRSKEVSMPNTNSIHPAVQ